MKLFKNYKTKKQLRNENYQLRLNNSILSRKLDACNFDKCEFTSSVRKLDKLQCTVYTDLDLKFLAKLADEDYIDYAKGEIIREMSKHLHECVEYKIEDKIINGVPMKSITGYLYVAKKEDN